MRFHILRDYVFNNIRSMKEKFRFICLWYLISLMVETRKHSLTFASELSGISKSAFSKFLMNNKKVIKLTSDDLSKRQARIYSKVLNTFLRFFSEAFVNKDSSHFSSGRGAAQVVVNFIHIIFMIHQVF